MNFQYLGCLILAHYRIMRRVSAVAASAGVGIASAREDDRDRAGCPFRGAGDGVPAARSDHLDPTVDQIDCQI